MQKFLVITFCMLFLILPLSHTYPKNRLTQVTQLELQKIFEIPLYGIPTIKITLVTQKTQDFAIIGTTLGVIALGSSILWYLHEENIKPNLIYIPNQGIFVATQNQLIKLDTNGNVIKKISFDSIHLLAKWNNYMIIIQLIEANSTVMPISPVDLSPLWVSPLQLPIIPQFVVNANIFGDASKELILVSRLGHVIAIASNKTILWEKDFHFYEPDSFVNVEPFVFDIDHDEYDELFLAYNGYRYTGFYVIDNNGSILFHQQFNPSRSIGGIIVCDIDGDTTPEIFVGTDLFYVIYDRTFNIESNVSNPEGISGDLSTFDIDMDGKEEVLAINAKGALTVMNNSGVEFSISLPSDYIFSYAIGMFENGNYRILVVGAKGTYELFKLDGTPITSPKTLLSQPSSNVYPAVYDTGENKTFIVPLETKYLLFSWGSTSVHEINIYPYVHPVVADINGDGLYEGLIVETARNSSIIALTAGGNKTIVTTNGRISSIAAADLDRDGQDEIIYTINDTIYAFGSMSWSIKLNSTILFYPAIDDVDDDGKLEIVVNSGSVFYVISWDGKIERRFDVSTMLYKPFGLADIDLDRESEIIAVTSSGVTCYSITGRIELSFSARDLYAFAISDADTSESYLNIIISTKSDLEVKDKTGKTRASISSDILGGAITDFAVVDLNNDDMFELIGIIPSAHKLVVIRIADGAILTEKYIPDIIGTSRILIDNFDSDNNYEILIISASIIGLKLNVGGKGEKACFGINKYRNFYTGDIVDRDNDGLTDFDEFKYGTDPLNPDSDGDGFFDGVEIKNGWNPLDSGSPQKIPIFWLSLILSTIVLIIIAIYHLRIRKR